MSDAGVSEAASEEARERLDLLALCTEEKRLGRGDKAVDDVRFVIREPDLWVAAVSSYNVVVDAEARRIQHGCRDFLGEGREGRLCKHVAGVFLAMDPEAALPMLRELTDPDGGWHLEVIAARGFNR